jgi:arginase family enzyme
MPALRSSDLRFGEKLSGHARKVGRRSVRHVWVVLGAPFDSSGTGRGEEHAPEALRAAGLPAVFGAADAGDVAPPLRDRVRDPETAHCCCPSGNDRC